MSETHVNFLGGSPLNRLSWLRSSTTFLSAVLANEETRWILFQGGQPLLRTVTATRTRTLAQLPTTSVTSLLGPLPVFGQGKEPGTSSSSTSAEGETISTLEAARLHGPAIVFLGLHEPELPDGKTHNALPSADFSAKTDPQAAAANIEGTPFFALDVSDSEARDVERILEEAVSKDEAGVTFEFAEPRSATSALTMFEAAIFAVARSMIDWNVRNKYCPACGSPTYSMWAGWKLGCTSLLPWANNEGKKPCPSAKGIHNFSHPRTDPVVIMAIIDETGEKILLGRGRRFPNGFYSTLAGFVEPGESFEDAVKREIWEEAGVRIWGVKYHSGQPWPYPANLMVGFYAFADASQPIRVDLDNELVDARWYTRAEVLSVLEHPQASHISRAEYKKFDEADKKDKATSEEDKTNTVESGQATLPPPAFKVPPLTAIAGVLIRDWVHGKIGKDRPSGASQKGNL